MGKSVDRILLLLRDTEIVFWDEVYFQFAIDMFTLRILLIFSFWKITERYLCIMIPGQPLAAAKLADLVPNNAVVQQLDGLVPNNAVVHELRHCAGSLYR